MAIQTFAELQQTSDNRNFVRKIQRAVGLVAPTTVTLPATIIDPSGKLIDLKTLGFLPIGIVTADGYTFGREAKKDEVDALGYASPVRSDVSSVARSVTVTPLETGRKHMQELRYGMDLSAVTQSPTTGELVFDEPDLPVDREYRFLVLGSDGPADENWIMGAGYGRVKVSKTDDEKWGKADPIQSQITFEVFTDNVIGSPVRHYLGGTAALKYNAKLGYTQGV